MFKYIKEAFTAMVQVQSTSELREGPRSSVPAPSAEDVFIGSCVRITSATLGAALPDPCR